MNAILIAAIITVTCALVAYSLFVFSKPKDGTITRWALTTLSVGLFLDFSATILMILGSRNIPITVHGVIGYSALSAMLVETILVWRHWNSKEKTEPLSKQLQKYTWYAYGWWVLAYIIGGMLAVSGVQE